MGEIPEAIPMTSGWDVSTINPIYSMEDLAGGPQHPASFEG